MNQKQLIKLQNDDLEIFAAKLAVVGSTLSSIGDALSTFSAILQLILISNEKSADEQNDDQTIDPKQIEEMQQEIKLLKKELQLLKKKENG